MVLSLVLSAALSVEAGPTDGGVTSASDATVLTPAAVASPVSPSPSPSPGDDDELEEMRAVEEGVVEGGGLEPEVRTQVQLRANVERLAYGSALADRLEGAIEQADESGEELPFALAPVTDVERFDVSLVKDRYDIPVEMQPLVAQYIHFFQTGGRKWFRRWMNRSSRFIPIMQPILEARGLPRDTVYLAMIESGFNTQAKSWARAVGPWQFIAGTAKMFNLREDFWVDDRRDPVKATEAAAAYLGLLYQTLGHWYLAWAGYNTGGGRVRMLIEKYGTRDFWALAEQKRGFARETKHYVPKLIAAALVAKHPEAFGFTQDEFEFEPVFEYDEVTLTDTVDLEILASAAGSTLDDLHELNPSVKRWCTPPATEKEPFTLRIPKGTKERFATEFAKYKPGERLNFAIHSVRKGDTLSTIAARYHSATEAIMHVNGLLSAKSLRIGTELAVPVPSARAVKAGKNDPALERSIARARRSGVVASRPEDEVPAGTALTPAKGVMTGGTFTIDKSGGKTKVTYGVARGDTLWSIARRFDVRVADVRSWNDAAGDGRGLKVGASLVIFPGAAADLSGAKK